MSLLENLKEVKWFIGLSVAQRARFYFEMKKAKGCPFAFRASDLNSLRSDNAPSCMGPRPALRDKDRFGQHHAAYCLEKR